MRRILTTALAAAIVVLAPATPALAHNELKSAAPAEGSVLTTAPAQVRLTFNDRLSSLITVVVTDATKQKVATGTPAVTGPTATVRFAGPVANGAYTVAYRVVAGDGHILQGTYGFRVAAPVAATTPAAPATTPAATASVAPASAATGSVAPPAEATTDEGGGVPTVALIAVPVLLLLAAGGVLLARRRRT